VASSSTHALYYLLGGVFLLQSAAIVFLLIKLCRDARGCGGMGKRYADMTHAARLALVGELTGAIAHQVTQPLSAILNNVETAAYLLPRDNSQLAAILTDVRQDALRAHTIVRRLRALLRKRELEFESVDINAVASTVLALVSPDAERRHVAIRTSLEPNLPRIAADPIHLQQVLLNLIVNAMDAMRDTSVDDRWLAVRTHACAGQCIEVSVLDNGRGIAPTHRHGLFEAFFTTKRDGLGLGLSIARSIVAMHGGKIWAENRESGGAIFVFTVPTT
jgi:signal transduction histidine kinase